MKQLSKTFFLALIVTISATMAGCSDDDGVSNSCIEPPCGTVDITATNLTLSINNPEDNVTSAVIIVDDVETSIPLNGLDQDNAKIFTCWTVIPDISANSSVVFGYELNGEPIVGALNQTLISSNELLIQIDGDSALLKDFIECNDTPSE